MIAFRSARERGETPRFATAPFVNEIHSWNSKPAAKASASDSPMTTAKTLGLARRQHCQNHRPRPDHRPPAVLFEKVLLQGKALSGYVLSLPPLAIGTSVFVTLGPGDVRLSTPQPVTKGQGLSPQPYANDTGLSFRPANFPLSQVRRMT